MLCRSHLSTCDGRPAELVIRVFPTGDTRPVCRACAARLAGMGLHFKVDETSWLARSVAGLDHGKALWP